MHSRSELPTPKNPPAAHDLSDAEFAELDDLLAATPEPLEPCDAVMLDGFLCGVLVQPILVEPDTWLPHVFDFEGQPLPDDVDPQWLTRTRSLILRRHAALNRAMVEDGWFDPLILEFDDEHPRLPPPEGGPDPLADLTSELRYKVDTVKRETPKVGRNDPCPCGSGKKYKHCHGA